MERDKRAERQLDILMERYPALTVCHASLWDAYTALRDSFDRGGKLLICGNGGSCADSEHIVGELMKGFCKKRRMAAELSGKLKELFGADGEALAETLEQGLPAIALTAHTGLSTAFQNDKDPLMSYAQQVLGYGNPGDVLLGITTSGNSRNVLYALELARAKGLRTITLTGKDGGKAGEISEITIIAPSQVTYQIQEYHLPIYHCLCLMLEDCYFTE